MKLQFKMGSCMVRILKISPQFCRISEFGSIKIREFATRIVAQRQEVTRRNGVRTLFFQRWELQIPDFFSLPNYKFGRTEISARMLNLQMEYSTFVVWTALA